MIRFMWLGLMVLLVSCFPEPPECGPALACSQGGDPCMVAVCEANRCIERPIDACGGDASDTAETEGSMEIEVEAEAELPETEPEVDTAVDPEPEVIADPEVEAPPEVTPDSDAETSPEVDTAPEIETTLDTEPDLDTAPDAETSPDAAPDAEPEVETSPDAAPDVEVEPEVVDPCLGGCGHLDQVCKVGVCGESGCEAVDHDGDCDDGQACTMDDRCEAGTCVGDAVVCEAIDDCHIAGVCNPSNGVCSSPARQDGQPCSDGDHCSVGELCNDGLCGGGNLPLDSADWFQAGLSPGTSNALVYDSAGTLWLIASVTSQNNSFGLTKQGAPVTLQLPVGASSGLVVVRFDASGHTLDAKLVAYSDAEIRLLDMPRTVPRFVPSILGGRLLVIAGVFSGEGFEANGASMGDVGEGRQGFILAMLENDLGLDSPIIIKNPGGLSDPVVGIAPTGEILVAVRVASDALASIGTASFRAPIGQEPTWFVYFSATGSILWQRVLKGAGPAAGGRATAIVMDANGAATLAGTWVGDCLWERVDGSGSSLVLQAFATDVEFTRLFLGRTSASGSLDVDATFASSRIGSLSNRVISLHTQSTGGNLAVHIVAGGPLIQDPTGSSIEIVPTPPSGRGYAAVLEFSADRSLGAVYLATGANIRTTAYRGEALTIVLAQGGSLTRSGVVVVPAPLSDVPITIAQLTGGLIATIAPFRLGDPAATALSAAFAFEPDGYGIGLTGNAANGNAYVTTNPSWTVGADRLQYVAFLNSRDGLICAER